MELTSLSVCVGVCSDEAAAMTGKQINAAYHAENSERKSDKTDKLCKHHTAHSSR